MLCSTRIGKVRRLFHDPSVSKFTPLCWCPLFSGSDKMLQYDDVTWKLRRPLSPNFRQARHWLRVWLPCFRHKHLQTETTLHFQPICSLKVNMRSSRSNRHKDFTFVLQTNLSVKILQPWFGEIQARIRGGYSQGLFTWSTVSKRSVLPAERFVYINATDTQIQK